MSVETKRQIKERAESDLEFFINLVSGGNRLLGDIHKEVIQWWEREDASSHQLLLLPRDHMKSALLAYRCAWYITKYPWIRILYISSTANLATKQLKFIKDILTSKIYRRYWPEMVNEEEGKREKWTETEISVDHPLRKKEQVRDPTIFTAGLTTGIVGLHCDIAALDDVVVGENAYTEEGRTKVRTQYSFLSSIEGADAEEWAVGTRYNLKDLYNEMMEMEVDEFDDEGYVSGVHPLYEVFERAVEDAGDGTGEFLWPRQQRHDGKWFGFDQKILAKKRAQYLDKLQFRAQYYNNPNDPDSATIKSDQFQYYDRNHVIRESGHWFIKRDRLNVFAAVDFAFSLKRRADYTAIVVVGVTSDHRYYVLDIERFKTDKISEYFDKILHLHQKWGFRKLRAEVTAAQDVIVEDLKQNYIKPFGLALSVVKHRPTKYEGSKEERVEATLQPRYDNMQIWHYRGGNCSLLEEELVQQRPPHDDIKDCLASAIAVCVAPSFTRKSSSSDLFAQTAEYNRFGGF